MPKADMKKTILEIVDELPENKLEEILGFANFIKERVKKEKKKSNSSEILINIIDRYNNIDEKEIDTDEIYLNRNKVEVRNDMFS